MDFNQDPVSFRGIQSWISLDNYRKLYERSRNLTAEIDFEEELFAESVSKKIAVEEIESWTDAGHLMGPRFSESKKLNRDSEQKLRKMYIQKSELEDIMDSVVTTVMEHDTLVLITNEDLKYADRLRICHGYNGKLSVAPTALGVQVRETLIQRNGEVDIVGVAVPGDTH